MLNGYRLLAFTTLGKLSVGQLTNAILVIEQGLSKQQKQAIATYIQEQSKLFKYCFDTVGNAFEDVPLTEESQRAIATTLYIQSAKHFNI